MKDCHVHLEKGPYTKEWLDQFICQAIRKDIDEVHFLEHTHVFQEFAPLYEEMSQYNAYQSKWYKGKEEHARPIVDYSNYIDKMRKENFPIVVKFGLEVCYSPEHENDIAKIHAMLPLDFLVGAIHWIDGWVFSHLQQVWSEKDVDVYQLYSRYYDLMEDLIRSNLFHGLAHPNSLSCFGVGPPSSFAVRYGPLAKSLKIANMYVEDSVGLALNYSAKELGMDRQMYRAMKQYGVKVETASDAHYPNQVGSFIKELLELREKMNA